MSTNTTDPNETRQTESTVRTESPATPPTAGSRDSGSAPARHWSWMLLLRLLLALDGLLLLGLGASFIFAPKQIQLAFHFHDLPAGVAYLVGLWGCVLLSMGLGYLVAATNPLRHLVWVHVAIIRGLFEFALGIVYLARGVVTLQQASFGIVVAALMTIAYLALYPRTHRNIRAIAPPAKAVV